MINVRPLYEKVALMRPDMDSNADIINYCIQEAVRETCRRTFLMREIVSQAVLASAKTGTITLTTGRSALKLHRMDILTPPNTTTTHLYPVTFQEMIGLPAENATGVPLQYAQRGPTFYLYVQPKVDSTLTYECSWVPTTDVETIELPESSMTAVEAKATSMLLKYGGPMRNLPESRELERDYRRAIGALRSISELGEVGEITMQTPTVVTTRRSSVPTGGSYGSW